ncbi:MAG: glycine cleavage system aminomethyltransferase GcvT [Bacteriovoracia bacterium]
MKKTSLYEEHLKLGAKIVEFGGWMMPVQYTSLADEHETCRKSVGLFDVSHMGEISVEGVQSLEFLNELVTNDVSKIVDNQAQYTVMCYPDGGCVDDLIIHRLSSNRFLLCVNASNTDKDFNWIQEQSKKFDVSVKNVSDNFAQIAIQGRNAEKLLQQLTSTPLSSIKYYWFQTGSILNEQAIIARTGYTGEDGFEIYVPSLSAPKIWSELLHLGRPLGIKPCGLGSRDTLRTEMKFPLYGHEIDDKHNPLEAGLGWVVKLAKPSFIGRKPLQELKEKGLKYSLVGLQSLTRLIPRQGYLIKQGDEIVGEITSGTLSPSLKYPIAIARLRTDLAKIGEEITVLIRDQKAPHRIVATPFYKRDY